MPRYFFHLRDGLDVPDEEGRELPDLATARACAMDLLRFEASETVKREGLVALHHRVEIVDEQGRVLEIVPLGDAVTVESKASGGRSLRSPDRPLSGRRRSTLFRREAGLGLQRIARRLSRGAASERADLQAGDRADRDVESAPPGEHGFPVHALV